MKCFHSHGQILGFHPQTQNLEPPCTVEPRFNEVAGDRPNLFVKSRVRYLDKTNLRGNDQNVRYIEVIVND